MRALVRCLVLGFVCLAVGSPAFAVCPSAPTLLTPANNSVEDFGLVTFSWTDDPNAASYEMYAGVDGDPLSLKETTTQNSKTVGIEPGRTIEWKIVAKAPSCPDVASAHFFFTTSCPSTPASLFS